MPFKFFLHPKNFTEKSFCRFRFCEKCKKVVIGLERTRNYEEKAYNILVCIVQIQIVISS